MVGQTRLVVEVVRAAHALAVRRLGALGAAEEVAAAAVLAARGDPGAARTAALAELSRWRERRRSWRREAVEVDDRAAGLLAALDRLAPDQDRLLTAAFLAPEFAAGRPAAGSRRMRAALQALAGTRGEGATPDSVLADLAALGAAPVAPPRPAFAADLAMRTAAVPSVPPPARSRRAPPITVAVVATVVPVFAVLAWALLAGPEAGPRRPPATGPDAPTTTAGVGAPAGEAAPGPATDPVGRLHEAAVGPVSRAAPTAGAERAGAPALAATVECAGSSASLTWDATTANGFAAYLVLASEGPAGPRYPRQRPTMQAGASRAVEGTQLSVPAGAGRRWLVVAVDASGAELARSEPVACPR